MKDNLVITLEHSRTTLSLPTFGSLNAKLTRPITDFEFPTDSVCPPKGSKHSLLRLREAYGWVPIVHLSKHCSQGGRGQRYAKKMVLIRKGLLA